MCAMKGKPDIGKFLDGASEGQIAAPKEEMSSVAESAKITKTIRLAKSTEILLKNEAHNRSMASGRRVTESDIINNAILQYLNK